MKAQLFRFSRGPLATALALVCGGATLAAAQSKPPLAGTAGTTNTIQQLPQSVFVIPATPKDGRNPFFPQSAQVLPQPVKQKDSPLDASLFLLNGITPNGPKRTAMINGRTFENGESGEIKLSSGAKVLIKCEEIRNDSAVIIVDGQRRELRMRFGL